MIKLFRKLRWSSLSRKRFPKYLLYATGEIVLVVIGILIALQINNWNENKNARKLEIVLLENLRKDLTIDTLDVNFNIKFHSQFLNEEKKLLNFLSSNLEQPEEEIDYNAALSTPLLIVLHESTFENLQNNAVGILTNNDLAKDIARFYDFFATAIQKIENDLPSYETYDEKLPYFQKYFKLDPNAPPMLIKNSESKDYYNPDFEKQAIVIHKIVEAKQDEGFKIILNESIFFRQVVIGFYLNLLNRIDVINNAIEKELEALQKR